MMNSWEFIALFLLILGNGVFAMAEIALVSSRKARLQPMAESGDVKAAAALDLMKTPGRFLATVQVGITLVGTLAGAIGGVALADDLSQQVAHVEWLAPYAKAIALVLVVIPITYFQVVIGELVPKALALRHAESISRHVARPMRGLSRLAAPAVSFLNASTEGFLRLFGVKPGAETPVTEEEIGVMLAQGAKAGVLEESQQDMMESVIEMGERRITSLMTPRPDIVWLDAEASPEDMEAVMAASTYSRFPVCTGSFDKLLGVVHAKDILARYLDGQALDLKAMARPVPTVPDSIPVLKALEAFRDSGETMAFVSDEYGTVQGLVTLHDVLQNILGDMAGREAQAPDPDVVLRSDGSWLMDGTKPIEEIRELLHLPELPDGEENSYQTLGGFVMAELGRIPLAGDAFEVADWYFEVMDMDGRRVDKVLVKPLEKSPPGADKDAAAEGDKASEEGGPDVAGNTGGTPPA